MYLGTATGGARAWTGTVQLAWDQVRFSTVGFNTVLYGPPEILDGLRAVEGHCVRIEGTQGSTGGINVAGWALLPDGTSFTEGGVTYTCQAFRDQVTPEHVERDPAPPVTSGGTVTTTTPLAPGAGTGGTAPPAGGGGGGGGGGNGEGAAPAIMGGTNFLPILAAGAALIFLARPGR